MPSPTGQTTPSERFPWLVVLIFLFCSTFSYIDRQILSLVVEPMKADLKLSDTQIGLLQGLAFALCYGIAGIPLARLADRGNRVRVASACVAIWSAATVACGFTAGYASLLVARMATAVSEAGLSPSALSVIADRTPRPRLPIATALYLLGPPLGGGLSLLLGGHLLGAFERNGGLALAGWTFAPWQAVFLTVGAPGLVLALIVLTVLREPPRRQIDESAGANPAQSEAPPALLATFKTRGRFLAPFIASTTFTMMAWMSYGVWGPTLFVREHGMSPAEAGKMLGPIFIVLSAASSLLAGFIASRGASETTLRRVLQVVIAGQVIAIPAAFLLPLAGSQALALVGYALLAVGSNLVASLVTVPLQLSVPNQVRGQMIALGGFAAHVVAGGIGPFAVGLLADRVFGTANINLALAAVTGGAAVLALMLGLIAARAARDLARS